MDISQADESLWTSLNHKNSQSSPRMGRPNLSGGSSSTSSLKTLITIWFFLIIIFFYLNSKTHKSPEFTVSNASLTQFSYTKTNHTLSYNLALNITLLNPNKVIALQYRDIQVIGYYGQKRFAFVPLLNSSTPLHLSPNSTTSFQNVLVQGHKLVLFAEPEFFKFSVGTAAGVYTIDILIAFQNQAVSDEVICNLKLPLSSNGTYAAGFETTKCSKVIYKRLGMATSTLPTNTTTTTTISTANITANSSTYLVPNAHHPSI